MKQNVLHIKDINKVAIGNTNLSFRKFQQRTKVSAAMTKIDTMAGITNTNATGAGIEKLKSFSIMLPNHPHKNSPIKII